MIELPGTSNHPQEVFPTMSTRFRLPGILALLATAVLVSTSCDSKSSASGSTDPLTTNFSVNLTSLMASIGGKPDSIVADVQVDGASVQHLSLDPSKISGSGLVRFPVDAAEGSKVQVVYKVWDGGGVVGAGTVTWVSGEALTVPRPNLAPTVSFDGVGEQDLLVRRNAKVWIRTVSGDAERALAALRIDWSGDGVVDDSIVPPKSQDSIQVSWGVAGRYTVTALLRDSAGLFRTDTLMVQVLSAAKVRLSGVDSASVGDTVVVDVAVAFDDTTQASATRLVWRLPGASPETTEVKASRSFVWTTAATRELIVSTVDPLGEVNRDTFEVDILQDAPVLDLGNFPGAVDLNTIASLPIQVKQSFGTIVAWGVDFGEHPSVDSWDTTGTGPIKSILHVFTTSGDPRIRVWVEDDDGNRVVKSGTLTVNASTSGAMLRRSSAQDTTISIHDSSVIQFVRNFAPGVEAASRVEWNIDGLLQPPVAVSVRRAFAWPKAGPDHFVAWRLLTAAGATTWDTVSVRVLQDAPILDLSRFPRSAGLDMWTTFRPAARQTWGRIVAWGMDFDGDTTTGWDTVVAGGFDTLDHVFDREGQRTILIFATDDDGNRSIDSARVLVQAMDAALVQRLTADSVTVSVGDAVPVRHRLSFPSFAARKASRMEWTLDGLPPESLAVDTLRTLSWSLPGRHVARVRVVGPLGSTRFDSIVVRVVQGVPTVDLSALPDTAGSGSRTLIRPKFEDLYGRIVQWKIDFDGDTTSGWDSVAAGSLPVEIFHSFSGVGDSLVSVWVLDDDGNAAVASRRIQVVKGAYGLIQVRMSSDTTVSIGDTAWVRLFPGFSDLAEQSRSRLVWKVDEGRPDTLPVVTGRGFIWPTVGRHQIVFRAIGEFGATNWDTLRVNVELDPPLLDFGLPEAISRNAVVSFLPGAGQKFGTIVAWGLDLDNDTTSGWDATGTTMFRSISRIFAVPGISKILMWAEDDDGNRTVSEKNVEVRTGSGAVLLLKDELEHERTVSIKDTVLLNLAVNFPAEWRDQYRIVWRIDGGSVESTAVLTSRSFVWNAPGAHRIDFRASGPLGATSWDSVQVQVLQGMPRILNLFRNGSGVNADITFSANVDPVFGSIVLGRWDWENDGAWDAEVSNPATQGATTRFASSATQIIRFQATDDDGNVVDTLLSFSARNSPPTFGALAFASPSVGTWIANTLQASIADLNGLTDLDILKIDWEADSVYDTTITVEGLSLVSVSHAWATPGTKNLRLLLADKSGETALGTISLVVTADAPVVTAIEPNRSAYRLGDPILLTARATDASVRSDYDRIAWDFEGDGSVDTIVSLVGSVGSVATQMVWSSRVPGSHRVCVTVGDLVGNSSSRCTTLTVRASPPRVFAHLTDSVPMATDTSRIWIDSIVTPSVAGVSSHYAEIWWMPRGGSWTKWSSAEFQALNAVIRIPERTPDWYVVVKAVQDNGEIGLDTLRARILEVFVDNRDGKKYPIVEIGGQRWMGRNLNWIPIAPYSDSVSSSCEATDPSCERYGRLYSTPKFIPTVNHWDRDSLIVQSICPDNWHVPSLADWNRLRSSLAAANPGVDWGITLRDRVSWGDPLPGQVATGDFNGIRIPGATTFWASAIPSEDRDTPYPPLWNHVLQMSETDAGTGKYAWITSPSQLIPGASLRCVANDRIHLWAERTMHDGELSVLGQGKSVLVRGITMDSTDVSVRVETVDGITSREMPAQFFRGLGLKQAVVTTPVLSTPGVQRLVVTATQSGSTIRDTIRFNPISVFRDERDGLDYDFVHWGGLRWMAEDLAYDTAGIRAHVDAQFDAAGVTRPQGIIYPLPTVLAGQARTPHGTDGPRGICPEGWRLPSSRDWQALIDAATVEGLDPNTAFRAWVPTYDSVWTKAKPGTNISGFNATRTGFLDGADAYGPLTGYWGGDEPAGSLDGATYAMFHDFDDVPFTGDGNSNMYIAVRCVSSIP
jgi:uncharacterized protein (TIGR02145 family)